MENKKLLESINFRIKQLELSYEYHEGRDAENFDDKESYLNQLEGEKSGLEQARYLLTDNNLEKTMLVPDYGRCDNCQKIFRIDESLSLTTCDSCFDLTFKDN